MKKIKKIALKAASALLACAAVASVSAEHVFAYTYAMKSASKEGTVSIEAVTGTANANGYGKAEKYRVTYSITRDNWSAYDEQFGGYFFIGNQMNPSGGCQFAYHTSGGQIWNDGAMIMGGMPDGTQVGKSGATAKTVSCSFEKGSLDEIPAYIAYAYQPASSAYLHITEEYGNNNHIWCYQSLKDVTVQYGASIDREVPALTASIVPTGNQVQVNGKIWSKTANIQLRAQDDKSRPGGIRIYQNGARIKEIGNPENTAVLQSEYQVTANGTYEADAYDQLSNTCDKIGLQISCIDRGAPSIQKLYLEDTGFTRNAKIIVQAVDTGCGLHAAAYSWNGGAWSSANEWEVDKNGTYTVKVRDALGNESAQTITVSNVDQEAPELSVKVTPAGKVTTRDGVLWSTKAELTATATDLKSGVKEIAVLDVLGRVMEQMISPAADDAESISKTLQLTTTELKNGSYKIRATDMLGNSVFLDQQTLGHVDADAPVIQEIRQEKQEDGTILLTVVAKDEGSGLAKQPYSIDGGKTWQEEPTFTITENGDYDILVRDWMEQTAKEQAKVTDIKEKEQNPADEDDSKDTDGKDNQDTGSGDNADEKDSGDGDADGGNQDAAGGDDGKENGDGGNGKKSDGDEKNTSGNNGGQSGNGGGNADQGKNVLPSPDVTGKVKEKLSHAKKELSDSLSGQDENTAVSANSIGNTGLNNRLVTEERKVTEPEPDYSGAEEVDIQEITAEEDNDTKETNSATKAVFLVLGIVFAAGCLGLILYLLLFYLRYSCVFYEMGEEDKKHRLCRLSLKESGDDWYLEVPDQKLGVCGTGRYLLIFHPSFAAEEKNETVIIDIDGKTLRERIARELPISI